VGHGRAGIAALALLVLLTPVPLAAGSYRLRAVEEDFTITTRSGERLRPVGVRFRLALDPDPSELRWRARVRRQLAYMLRAAPFEIRPERPLRDRHGRLRVQLHAADGTWLQEIWVREGLAVVDPAGLAVPLRERLLAAEQAARTAGVGIWREGLAGPVPAASLQATHFRFVLVEGVARETGCGRVFCYLNFGVDRRRDFTLRVRRPVVRAWKRRGFALEALVGRRLRLRGWIFAAGGPMMELDDPASIELLP